MRILACADLHGHPERVARVRALVREHQPQVILLPGDLTHAGRGEEALTLLHAFSLPVLAIPGNMDAAAAVVAMRRHGTLLEGDPRIIDGVAFGGPDVEVPCDVLVVHEPRLLACGHVHESPGVERVGDTLVVNCTMGDGKNGGALIEVTPAGVTAHLL